MIRIGKEEEDEEKKNILAESFVMVQNSKFMQVNLLKWRMDLTEMHDIFKTDIWEGRNEGTFKHVTIFRARMPKHILKLKNEEQKVQDDNPPIKNDTEHELYVEREYLLKGLEKYYNYVKQKVCAFTIRLIIFYL